MDNKSLDQWWAGLTIAQKERIASKAASKRSGNSEQVLYPECTRWWLGVEAEQKEWVYAHCTDKHGLLLEEWREGKTYSY